MHKILSLILTYFREHFSLKYFIPLIIFSAILTWLNYKFDFETQYITYEVDPYKRLLNYFLMYLVAFGGAYLLYLINPKDRAIIFSARLWGLIIGSVFLFSFRSWFFQYDIFTEQYFPPEYQTVVKKYFMNLEGLVWLFIPCFLYWWFADRKNQPIYGFHSKGVVLKPYFILLLLMGPLVVWASTQGDFLLIYPRAFHLGISQAGTTNQLLTLLYEVCYSIDFITTEFFFRGFLILAFARFAGPKAILPMCVFYLTIHFEKPLGETISSFFGGWILGILAYETRSIYGGIIVHLGIALLMEVVAFLAHGSNGIH